MHKPRVIFAIFLLIAGYGCSEPVEQQPVQEAQKPVVETVKEDTRPNILLIVADDMGYTDIGAFGGEINTPNLDSLAQQGVLLTNFHSSPTCSPTRAMLLSGTDNHLAGLGAMDSQMTANQRSQPGYEGYLNFRVASLAELLRDAGYHTYMTGKWHLGLEEATSPAGRGFEKSFDIATGGGGHFTDLGITKEPALYRENGKLTALPEDFYSSRFYAERMIEYIGADQGDGKPFFAYLAFTAPHWPLQAPRESIERYKGKYDKGYEVLFEQRMQALKDRGLLDAEHTGPALEAGQKPWDELTEEQKLIEARIMEIYAAMIDDMDHYIGKVIDYLKESGEFDNTFVFFLSDNGAEGHDLSHLPFGEWGRECCDNSYENMGNADSYIWQGPNWGRASVGPGRYYKGFVTQGGILVPAFASFPKLIGQGQRYDKFLSVMDVMPTLLELAGVRHPGSQYKGREVLPMKGVSMLPMLQGETGAVHDAGYVMGWELFGKRAIRKGDWKIVNIPEPFDNGSWRLYNLADDPSELNDLVQQEPQRLQAMLKLWDEYAAETGVILPDRVFHY